ncbi:hypothetical protein [Krasilnikovia sp. MM14-A1259]|uniref:hypothetical protein n=1 Tax=Krasilnikovia sp. MM14-A1259 TaxID=3373539 RepID=UPI00399C7213
MGSHPQEEWRSVLEPLDFTRELAAYAGDGSGDTQEATTDVSGAITLAVRGRLRAVGAHPPGSRPVSVTLTGAQWVSVETELASSASIADEMEGEGEEVPDGSVQWKLLDLISARLGGPTHPALGYDR